MKISILGAGPGALALSCYLGKNNYTVTLYEMPEFKSNIEGLLSNKTIDVDGYISGKFDVDYATTDIREAIDGADYIFIVTHAAAHKMIAALSATYLKENQSVILFPGYVGGGVAFEHELKRLNPALKINILEASVLPFACRRIGPNSVYIGGFKQKFLLSGNNASQQPYQFIQTVFPGAEKVDNFYEPGLNEVNFIIHTCTSLLNIGYVESGHDWTFYRQGMVPAVGEMIERADKERLALLNTMGLQEISLCQWMLNFYQDQGAKGNTVYEVMTNYEYFGSSKGPKAFTHRYFTEDIPYGLVPLASLGKKHNISMPTINMLIDLGSAVTGIDYRKTGRQI